eukprot:gene1858-2184_t
MNVKIATNERIIALPFACLYFVPFLCVVYIWQYNKVLELELKYYRQADLIVTISETDKREVILLDATGDLNRRDKVYSVRYVVGPEEITQSDVAGLRAIRWYVEHVAALLEKELPGVKLTCVGQLWATFLEALPNATQYVQFTGYMSEQDMLSLLDRSRVFVSPIIASTGINTKNVLALTRGIPLVTMPSGGKGNTRDSFADLLCYALFLIGLCSKCDDTLNSNPIDPFSIYQIARDPEGFASSVAKLYRSEDLWLQYSVAGPVHCKTWFGSEGAAEDLEAMFRRLHQNGSEINLEESTRQRLARRRRRKKLLDEALVQESARIS